MITRLRGRLTAPEALLIHSAWHQALLAQVREENGVLLGQIYGHRCRYLAKVVGVGWTMEEGHESLPVLIHL